MKKTNAAEWRIRFAGNVRNEMNVYGLSSADMGKILGITAQTFNAKLRDPLKFSVKEFCVLTDFLHLERGTMISSVKVKKN